MLRDLEPGKRSLSFWLLFGLLALVVLLYFSRSVALLALLIIYMAAGFHAVQERFRERSKQIIKPPVEPLPPLKAPVYQQLEEFFPASRQAPPVQRVQTPGLVAPPAATRTLDRKLATIRDLHRSVYELIVVNRHSPVVDVLGDDILREAADLALEAERIDAAKQRLRSNLQASRVSQDEISDIEGRAEGENDERLRATLHETVASKKAELNTVQQMQREIEYQDALISQAEASLSEMRSRLALTIARSKDYAHAEDGNALTEASGELRSISEAMRQTLHEIS